MYEITHFMIVDVCALMVIEIFVLILVHHCRPCASWAMVSGDASAASGC
jgi:hypothetical protein